ncbi:hypothetical protein [Sporomusa sp. GT1]|uniref:hypothetical protein n=1 Tax=Sporomusa sp. GT1 TaxID=1534747 RepID=UPI00166DCA35|nr:hypothetical protein [Sporomusa sp. GT1]
MSKENTVLNYANQLEGLLRKYLNCHYTDFGVKANDNLTKSDWKSPINFALGHKYAISNNDPKVKESIDFFLGNDLQGESIGDIIERYEYYGFNNVEDAYKYIKDAIANLEKILFD